MFDSNEATILVNQLMSYYHVYTISELANKLGVSQPSISQWKKNNYVKAIANKCRELGIYNEIFGNLHSQTIQDNHGQVAQNVSGNQTFNPTPAAKKVDKRNDEVDSATYILFLECYEKAINNDDLKGLRLHLMDY